MTKPRVIETNEGIQDELTAETFDVFARFMRDKGWNGVDGMIASGIESGDMLEIGPGPGYVGLELARRVGARSLTGCEISSAMIRLAEKNAAEYGLSARYVLGNAMEMPFEDESFDCVVSNGSLHEWENPVRVFGEIKRVLRPGGRYCVTDLRRDAAGWKRGLVYASTKPKEMRPGLLSSLRAAYTAQEISGLLEEVMPGAEVKKDFFRFVYRRRERSAISCKGLPMNCRQPFACV